MDQLHIYHICAVTLFPLLKRFRIPQIPLQISDSLSLQYFVPSITTFEQPWGKITNYVYELLIGLITESRQHLHITFQAKFQENESLSPSPRPGALRFSSSLSHILHKYPFHDQFFVIC